MGRAMIILATLCALLAIGWCYPADEFQQPLAQPVDDSVQPVQVVEEPQETLDTDASAWYGGRGWGGGWGGGGGGWGRGWGGGGWGHHGGGWGRGWGGGYGGHHRGWGGGWGGGWYG